MTRCGRLMVYLAALVALAGLPIHLYWALGGTWWLPGGTATAGQDLAQVVEHDHAVAEQAPSLLGSEATVRATARSGRSAGGHAGRWGHIGLPPYGAAVIRVGGPSGSGGWR
jgi:hypothetical protein